MPNNSLLDIQGRVLSSVLRIYNIAQYIIGAK